MATWSVEQLAPTGSDEPVGHDWPTIPELCELSKLSPRFSQACFTQALFPTLFIQQALQIICTLNVLICPLLLISGARPLSLGAHIRAEASTITLLFKM